LQPSLLHHGLFLADWLGDLGPPALRSLRLRSDSQRRSQVNEFLHLRVAQGVVDFLPLPPTADIPTVVKHAEMRGHVGRRKLNRASNLTNVMFSTCKHAQNTDPMGVGKNTDELREPSARGLVHINSSVENLIKLSYGSSLTISQSPQDGKEMACPRTGDRAPADAG